MASFHYGALPAVTAKKVRLRRRSHRHSSTRPAAAPTAMPHSVPWPQGALGTSSQAAVTAHPRLGASTANSRCLASGTPSPATHTSCFRDTVSCRHHVFGDLKSCVRAFLGMFTCVYVCAHTLAFHSLPSRECGPVLSSGLSCSQEPVSGDGCSHH